MIEKHSTGDAPPGIVRTHEEDNGSIGHRGSVSNTSTAVNAWNRLEEGCQRLPADNGPSRYGPEAAGMEICLADCNSSPSGSNRCPVDAESGLLYRQREQPAMAGARWLALPEAAAYLALRSKRLTISRIVSLDSWNSRAIAVNVPPLHLRA